jgi:hypothetical protein
MKKGVSLTSMSLRMFKTIVFASQKHFLVHSVHEMLVADRAGGVSDRWVQWRVPSVSAWARA